MRGKFASRARPGAELYANAARRLYDINRSSNSRRISHDCIADERLPRKFLPSRERWRSQVEGERAIRADRFARIGSGRSTSGLLPRALFARRCTGCTQRSGEAGLDHEIGSRAPPCTLHGEPRDAPRLASRSRRNSS